MERCERVFHFMGREVTGRRHSECKLSGAVAKLQGDKTASLYRNMSDREVVVWGALSNIYIV